MIRTTVLNGRDIASYRDPDHPIQLAIVQAIDDLAHEQATNAIDGCGAPLYAISLYGLARAFGRIASASDGAEHRVATAMRSHPEYVSGTSRDELELHRAIPGLMGKQALSRSTRSGWETAVEWRSRSAMGIPRPSGRYGRRTQAARI